MAKKRQIKQYEHKDKKRANNPPVGLVTPDTDKDAGKKTYAYDPHLDPSLQWAGKAEHTSFDVPTVSLHVHERIDPRTILEAVGRSGGNGAFAQGSLFSEAESNPPLRQALDFYQHAHGWSNRLVAGDSLLVMNSLLEKEGLAGKVQMIYLDPPYGIRYGSNFQPFVNRRDVKDGKDEDLTQEPETLKAFRDTWELGIHSYLTYLRDRFTVSHELLTETGSIFVQIGDENVHLVRCAMDDVFGADQFVCMITYRTTTTRRSKKLSQVSDRLLWFSKNLEHLKYHQLFLHKAPEVRHFYKQDESGRWYYLRGLSSQGLGGNQEPFECFGITYYPPSGRSWSVHPTRLPPDRVVITGKHVRAKVYWDDFPVSALADL